MRSRRSKNGRARSARKRSYWWGSHIGSIPCAVDQEPPRDVDLPDRGPVSPVDDAGDQIVGGLGRRRPSGNDLVPVEDLEIRDLALLQGADVLEAERFRPAERRHAEQVLGAGTLPRPQRVNLP